MLQHSDGNPNGHSDEGGIQQEIPNAVSLERAQGSASSIPSQDSNSIQALLEEIDADEEPQQELEKTKTITFTNKSSGLSGQESSDQVPGPSCSRLSSIEEVHAGLGLETLLSTVSSDSYMGDLQEKLLHLTTYVKRYEDWKRYRELRKKENLQRRSERLVCIALNYLPKRHQLKDNQIDKLTKRSSQLVAPTSWSVEDANQLALAAQEISPLLDRLGRVLTDLATPVAQLREKSHASAMCLRSDHIRSVKRHRKKVERERVRKNRLRNKKDTVSHEETEEKVKEKNMVTQADAASSTAEGEQDISISTVTESKNEEKMNQLSSSVSFESSLTAEFPFARPLASQTPWPPSALMSLTRLGLPAQPLVSVPTSFLVYTNVRQ
eukprot:g984.t1